MTDPRIVPVGANLEAFARAAGEIPIFRRAGVRDAVVVTSDIAFPMFNLVCAADFRPGREEERTGDLADLMTAHGLPWMWWETPGHEPCADALRARGLQHEPVPGMYAELSGPVDLRRELRVEPLNEGNHATILDVIMAGFEMPEFVREPMGALLSTDLDPEPFIHLLAWEDDQPVGCGTAFLDERHRRALQHRGPGAAPRPGHRVRRHGRVDERRRRSGLHPRGPARDRDGAAGLRAARLRGGLPDPAVDLDAAGGLIVARSAFSARKNRHLGAQFLTPRRENRARHVRTGV